MNKSVTLKHEIEKWQNWNKNSEDEKRLQALIKDEDANVLGKCFSQSLKFGTAGLRANMDVGPSSINDVTVIQVTQGIVPIARTHYDESKKLDKDINLCVVIGYDGRRNSNHFADLVGTVFINKGFKVYNFGNHVVPTPLVPFTVNMVKACCGIMITASHNPKNDNGYKLYWSNGVQIISPLDKQIEESIVKHIEPEDTNWDISIYQKSNDVEDIYERSRSLYLQNQCLALDFLADLPIKPSLVKFTYTAMHGVGFEMITSIFASMKLPTVIPVEKQVYPDKDFPTVIFPNPEEGKGVLNLAIETATNHESNVIIANDPDADRVTMAFRYPKNTEEWKLYTGNEIGALLAWWIWMNWRRRNPKQDPSTVHMISSTVSSTIISSIARKHNFHHHETLTGFKWMGNYAYEIIENGDTVLFAFEEAIGFMCGTCVLDKDGVAGAAVLAQMVIWLNNNGKTPDDQLDEIYSIYGFHLCKTIYYLSYNPKMTDTMFCALRHMDGDTTKYSYPNVCGKYKIVRIIDLTVGKELLMDNPNVYLTPKLPSSASTQMITFYFENGTKITVRTSGTEPKIKCYVELKSNPGDYSVSSKDQYTQELDNIIKNVVEYFYKPEKHGFISKS